MIAAMRIRMAVPLRRLLLVFYFIVFALAALAPANFIPVSSTLVASPLDLSQYRSSWPLA